MYSDYWDVVNEIENFRKKSRGNEQVLRYLLGNVNTFGGNFSNSKRFSYFNHQNDSIEVPCGFLKEFPISDSG